MNQQRIKQVLLGPHVSEKSTLLADSNKQIVFRVRTDATKPEIKKAVEQLFKVEVGGIQVLNVKGKVRRFGKITGRRNDWKKAVVSLKEGHDINFVGAE